MVLGNRKLNSPATTVVPQNATPADQLLRGSKSAKVSQNVTKVASICDVHGEICQKRIRAKQNIVMRVLRPPYRVGQFVLPDNLITIFT